MKEITAKQIEKFHVNYQKERQNKQQEKEIIEKGLEEACLNQKIVEENKPIFNLELPESKRYDQKENHRCWIYAGLNVIKYNVAKNLNIDLKEFSLSNPYLAFFDKLEKSNTVYERIIHSNIESQEELQKEKFLEDSMIEDGYWSMFVAVVEKYGIVPENIMPETKESLNYKRIEIILTEKVKKDVLFLLEKKKQKASIEELENEKEKYLQENYEMLSKLLGEPKFLFDYKYQDQEGKKQELKEMTPLAFKEQFLTLNLKDFVVIGNVPTEQKEYNKVYQKKYTENIQGKSQVKFLNLTIEELKTLAIKQLKDGISIWMGIYIRKYESEKLGILDPRLYDYEKILGLKRLTKKEALILRDIFIHHAMTICGVHLEEEKPIRWKVEDSYGIEEKIQGYYVMNDRFFDEFVLNLAIHKKYLTKEQQELWKEEPIKTQETAPY